MDELTKGLVEHLRKNGSDITVRETPRFLSVNDFHPVEQGEKTMSTERDTHFEGFARLLWDDLKALDHGFIDIGADGLDSQREARYTAIIAQRAYDLAQHVVWECPITEYEFGVNDVTDLTEWPNTSQPPL